MNLKSDSPLAGFSNGRDLILIIHYAYVIGLVP
jgi:hypothetical protein